MITITVPPCEFYDQRKNEFYKIEKQLTLQLEHSLISVQKWEAKWGKCFLNTRRKTQEEAIDYIRCMCITPNVRDEVFYCIPASEMQRIAEYIEKPMTALVYRNTNGAGGMPRKKEIVTADIIYYWMISYGIPSEYRKWHLNQLMTLIQVFNEKNQPKKKRKRSTAAILNDYKAINEANRKKFNTKG